MPSAPHEVLLVIDGTTGQNAINQCRAFNEAVGVTGLVVTKLDGSAKGGVLFALARNSAYRSASSAWVKNPKTCAYSNRRPMLMHCCRRSFDAGIQFAGKPAELACEQRSA